MMIRQGTTMAIQRCSLWRVLRGSCLWVGMAFGGWAREPSNPPPAEPKTYTFGVVPQQSATQLAEEWGPLLRLLEAKSGLHLKFATAPDIPAFEKRLAAKDYDFAYMNPYHYSVFHQHAGYGAFAREKGRRLKGIVVVRKDSPWKEIADLRGLTVAFPAPASFAATVLVQGEFAKRGIPIKAQYVQSHDSSYLSVAKGLFPAGSGVERTFANMEVSVRDQLRILWSTASYTAHAFAAQKRVPAAAVRALGEAMFQASEDPAGRVALERLGFQGIEAGKDRDWDDVRSLKIHLLEPGREKK